VLAFESVGLERQGTGLLCWRGTALFASPGWVSLQRWEPVHPRHVISF